MTGAASKRKGYRGEKACVDLFAKWRESGLPVRARRGDGTIGEDVYVHVGASEFRIECKFYERDIVKVRKWLVGADGLFFKCNKEQPWIALRPDALKAMLEEAYREGQVSGINHGLTSAIAPAVVHYRDGTTEEVGGQSITKQKVNRK